jgi:hypothetical protein
MASQASTFTPTPPTLEAVPVKYRSTSSCSSPTASKIWAPVYERIVEMPIFERIFSRPLPTALIVR